MISDRTTIQHPGVVDGTKHSIPYYIVKHAKGFLQLLKDLIWLDLLESATELVVHRYEHKASVSGPIRNLLQISVLDQISSTDRREFECRICYHIKNLLMLQDNPQFLISAIEIGIL